MDDSERVRRDKSMMEFMTAHAKAQDRIMSSMAIPHAFLTDDVLVRFGEHFASLLQMIYELAMNSEKLLDRIERLESTINQIDPLALEKVLTEIKRGKRK
jgi:hypothetical protein